MPKIYDPSRGARRTRLARQLFGLTLAALAWHPAAMAQPAMTAPQKPVFAIRGFDIAGDNPLSVSETTAVLAPFLRADATIDTLQSATTALEQALKARGYGLHRVVLPPQEVGDAVKLSIVKFTISKISVDGLQRYSEANIRASVPELKEGESPNFKTLAVQTAIANESQGKQLQISLKESEDADQIDARVAVTEAKPWNFAVSLSNTGAHETGRDRLTLSGGHSNLFDLDHQFVGAYTTSIERTSDVQQYGFNYRIPLYRLGGVVAASYTHSTVVGDFGALKSTGAGQTMGLSYSHYLAPAGGYRSYIVVGIDDKRFDIAKINDVLVPGQQVRRSRPLSLGYNARVQTNDASWGYDVGLVANLSGGSGNSLAAYQSEDPRIATARWKALRANTSYLSTMGAGWLWSARAQFQYSPDALISGEQFGLGGASSVRGTNERALSGDRGLFTSLELTTPELRPGLRLIGFVDAGWLRNHNTVGTARPASDSLASAGLGLRYNTGSVGVAAEWGRVVSGSALAAGNAAAPRAGDNRLHLTLTARF